MSIQFDPQNKLIQQCLQGINREENGKPDEANLLFLQAWHAAADDFEKFITAYFVARHQKSNSDKLKWLETSLQFALKTKDDTVKSALPTLYLNIAQCCDALGDSNKAKTNDALANSYQGIPFDKGPFYHGTKADLQVGDLLTAKRTSNYQPELKMNHVYFTALLNGAGLAASLAKGEGIERVYLVEPTVSYENDPNVTDKKFPGNLTRSYRSQEPLKIVGEVTAFRQLTPEELRLWREKLANTKGKIIN